MNQENINYSVNIEKFPKNLRSLSRNVSLPGYSIKDSKYYRS